MYIKYKWWKSMVQEVRKAFVRNRDFEFTRTNEGICDVKNRECIEQILRSPDYAIAYEKYGISFDADGNEIQPVVAQPEPEQKKGPGRPKKG